MLQITYGIDNGMNIEPKTHQRTFQLDFIISECSDDGVCFIAFGFYFCITRFN